MKIDDIRRLEEPINRLAPKWEAVPKVLRTLALPVGFLGLLGVAGLLMLWMARGRLFDFWGSIGFAASLILLLGGVALNLPGFLRGVLEYLSPRRTLYGSQVLVVVLLAFVLLAIVNYLAARHYKRWDLSPERVFTLDERTRNLLAKVDQNAAQDGDLIIHYFMDPNPDQYSGYRLGEKMLALLEEYGAHSQHVKVHTYNWASVGDRERFLKTLREMKIETNAASLNWVLITYKGQRKDLKQSDLLETVPPMFMYQQREMPPPKFKGEDALSTTIRDLMQAQKTVCYFLTGHKERSTSTGRGSLSTLSDQLRGLNMEVKSLNLPEQRHVPPDANVILIPDPQSPAFLPEEIEKLKEFVKNSGGHVVVFGEPYKTRRGGAPSGIEEFLLNYGVKLRNDFFTLQLQPVPGGYQLSDTVAATVFGDHPSVETFKEANQAVIFLLPSLIETVEAKDAGYEAKFLVKAANTAGKGNYDNQMPSTARGDVQGTLILAAVSEPRNKDSKEGKVAAFADCDFIADGEDISFKGAGIDLVMNVISSFVGKSENIGIQERAPERRFITLMPTSQAIFYWGVVVALPLAVVLAGVFVLLIRRR